MKLENFKKSSLLNFLIIFLSSTFGLFLIVVVDFLYSKYQNHIQIPVGKGDNALIKYESPGWYQPNSLLNGFVRFGPKKFFVKTDKDGFRINDKKNLLSTKLPNVLFLGDSFTWGSGLNWEDTYPGQFEERYGGTVYNGGAESYSPTAHFFRLKQAIKSKNMPKNSVVVMAIDISDVNDESTRWISGKEGSPPINKIAQGYIESPKETFNFKAFFRSNFHLLHRLAHNTFVRAQNIIFVHV